MLKGGLGTRLYMNIAKYVCYTAKEVVLTTEWLPWLHETCSALFWYLVNCISNLSPKSYLTILRTAVSESLQKNIYMILW